MSPLLSSSKTFSASRSAHPSSSISRSMETLSTPLKKTHSKSLPFIPPIPSLCFGPEQWRDYFGAEVGPVPPLPSNIAQILASPSFIEANKTTGDEVICALFPKLVNNTPLSIDRWQEIVKTPKKGTPALFARTISWTSALNEHGPTPLSNSRWLVMTKKPLPNSFSVDYGAQVKLVEKLAKETGLAYTVSNLFDTLGSVFLQRVWKGDYLYANNFWTRVQDYTLGSRLVVGLSTQGVRVETNQGGGSAEAADPRIGMSGTLVF